MFYRPNRPQEAIALGQYPRFHQQSRRIALCGLLTALSTVILILEGLIRLAGVVCPVLAMLCLLPILSDYGPGTTLLAYAATAVLGVLLCADKEAALLYVFLGWYPALRPRLEKLPRLPRLGAKAGVFLLAVTLMYTLILHLFRLEAVVAEFSEYSNLMLAGLLLFGCLVFLVTDRLIGTLLLLYQHRKRGPR